MDCIKSKMRKTKNYKRIANNEIDERRTAAVQEEVANDVQKVFKFDANLLALKIDFVAPENY